MAAVTILRPVVRSYSIRQASAAAVHVRGGGHALVWDSPKRARLVVPFFEDDVVEDLGWWSILDIRKQRYQVIRSGKLKGLIETLVPPDCHGIVRRRAIRDEPHRGSIRRMRLDCLACGACCRANQVILDGQDVERFVQANRRDLVRPPFTKRNGKRLVLRLNASRACRHLLPDNRCAVYALRPGMCREFPAGSECCLSARAEELGIWDGNDPLEPE
jgi:uncharacterized protein